MDATLRAFLGAGQDAEQGGEVGLEAGVADRGGVHADDLDALARGEAGDGAEHRDAVVAVGVDRAAAQAAGALDHHPVRGRLDLAAERAAGPSVTVSIRSDSLRRSSAASRIVVVPSAKQAARATSGSSSIASGISAPPTSVAAQRAERTTRRSRDRLAAALAARARPRSAAPIRSRIVSRPVRVGLRPTPSEHDLAAGDQRRGDDEEGGRGEVGGDDDPAGLERARRAAITTASPSRRDLGARPRRASARCGRGSAAARPPGSRPRRAARRRAGRT